MFRVEERNMYLFVFLTLLGCSLAAPSETKSPCLEKFEYTPSGLPGKVTGTLNLLTDYKLYGAWVRLIFDSPVKTIKVEGDVLQQAIYDKDSPSNEVLLKNRDFIINKNVPVKIPIVIAYEGDQAPNLIGYRLNGRDICPGLE